MVNQILQAKVDLSRIGEEIENEKDRLLEMVKLL